MEKYSKAVSEMYSQFEKRETHPMKGCVGRRAVFLNNTLEVVGYADWTDGTYRLIVDASPVGGWAHQHVGDVIFRECKSYLYVSIDHLRDSKLRKSIQKQLARRTHSLKKREAHPMEKYMGRSAIFRGKRLDVIGYRCTDSEDEPLLIADASQIGGWTALGPFDVVFKECEKYWYVGISNLKTEDYD